ncbi:hypothetical protein Bca52824_030976 [Brassica carinata]|uniref:Uncharacterized protein n=1 Tax=Brassica carinata TaxID=52824 RepID=A0A8X7V3Q6_BRACI|nr:hypothetical protein Bca52824_030976 [Brassica carinata]
MKSQVSSAPSFSHSSSLSSPKQTHLFEVSGSQAQALSKLSLLVSANPSQLSVSVSEFGILD